MRMIDRSLDLDILAGRKPAPGLAARLGNAASKVLRAWLNRGALNRLRELDDRQLLDLGLTREDVREAITSSFFSDAGLHLTIAARERARRHLRCGHPD
ncbi:DUF1127 domain-containing protein [Shinella pollutisoli]|uniref:DUF1127 domain-containing protein n=1 Tax=Shinella pollutisoli TaxID=2250594 RepID=A0ABV7DDZ5_9HYPH|nr:DUF1127 domain-containing protein [Shinella pollutisoli]